MLGGERGAEMGEKIELGQIAFGLVGAALVVGLARESSNLINKACEE